MLCGLFLLLDSGVIMPRQPAFRLGLDGVGMPLEGDQVIEGVDAGVMSGRDDGGDHIGDGGAGGGFEKQGIFASADDPLQGLLQGVIVQGSPFEPAN
jgi:hypothetical protein